jgi:hypothetical protein
MLLMAQQITQIAINCLLFLYATTESATTEQEMKFFATKATTNQKLCDENLTVDEKTAVYSQQLLHA